MSQFTLLIGARCTGKTTGMQRLLSKIPNRPEPITPILLTKMSDELLANYDGIGIEELNSIKQLIYCINRLKNKNMVVVLTSQTFHSDKSLSFYNDLPESIKKELNIISLPQK